MSADDPSDTPVDPETVPTWEDDYLQAVADRLQYNYDLERDSTAGGERFELYGRLAIESQKQFLHQSINWANYETREHLFVRRVEGVSRADLDGLVELGHELADDWIEADETHQGTEFTFVLVVPSIPDEIRAFVDGFRDRTLLKYGYYGDYEINLVVVDPDRETAVASQEADVATAFELWRDPEEHGSTGLLGRLRGWLG